jgi:dihydroflavonol-4-reductase
MNIAVTGASGHIGNVLCRQLLADGHHVRAQYNSDVYPLKGLDLELKQGNVLNKDFLLELFRGCDAVIHAAALISINGDPDGSVFRTNTHGPRLVMEAAKECHIKRLIHLSSVHAVTELPHHTPYNEERPYKTAADPAYDHSKAVGEQILRDGSASGPTELVIVRPSCVIGPYDFKPSKIGAALLDFYHQKMPFLPPGGYDLIDVRDVSRSIIKALDAAVSPGIYLLSGKYYNFKELAAAVHKVTGKKVPQIVIPHRLLNALLPLASWHARIKGAAPSLTRESIAAIMNGHPQMDHRKAKNTLGHSNRPLEKSLNDFYTWHFESKNILKHVKR